MRILIVDDEKLTRDGLITSIDWKALSFDQVDQADDGLNAIAIAKLHPPDILLTDVRMPRMDGIELVKKIQKLNPDCSIIFMSGYSDKEYLLAAIKLRAIRYVEKPINKDDIMDALTQSIHTILQNKEQQKSKDLFTKESASRFAQRLTYHGYDIKNDTFIDEANLRTIITASTIFTTCIISINTIANNFIEEGLSAYIEPFDKLIEKWHLKEIHFIKNDSYLVIQLYGNNKPTEDIILKIGKHIKSIFLEDMKYFIIFGKTVTGPGKVFDSYNYAVILLQSAFFFEYGSILTYNSNPESITVNNVPDILIDFTQALKDKNIAKARELAQSLYLSLKHNRTLLTNIIKDMYYKLIMQINSTQYDLKLQTQISANDSESLLENISNCNILLELHQLLSRKIDEFEGRLQTGSQENSTIFLIREYISKHYVDYTLSIKDISDHVHLSSSYLCTVFKTETGETLNQYITDYRIEIAKQLLSDSRNKITEISSRVGYCDGNYFGKAFKKVVGLTPSEYREKETS